MEHTTPIQLTTRRVLDYLIVTREVTQDLEEEVQKLVREDHDSWEPQGAPFAVVQGSRSNVVRFHQALVLVEYSDG